MNNSLRIYDTEFDKLINEGITHPKNDAVVIKLNWLPWIGEMYSEGGILFVGESNYKDEIVDPIIDDINWTRSFINDEGFNVTKGNSKLVNNINSTFNIESDIDRQKLWSNVAYFNVVQRAMVTTKERPQDEDFTQGWSMFLKVVEILKPRYIIKWGVAGDAQLGDILLVQKDKEKITFVKHEQHEKIDGTIPRVLEFESPSIPRTTIMMTQHPSMIYTPKIWNEKINEIFPNLKILNI